MPKPPAVPYTEIFSKIGHLPFWDGDGHLKKKSDDVWIDATTALDKRMSIPYLYIYISKNRHNIVNKIVEKYGLDISTGQDVSLNLNNTTDSNWSTDETGGRLPFKSLRTTVTIEENVWKTMEPRLVQYDGEQKWKLQPGWTARLYNIIWNQVKLPCPLSFHSEIVRMSDGNYLTIKAYCNECGNVFHAYAVQSPNPDLILHVSTCDTRRVIHKNKRQLKGAERDVVGKDLTAGTSTYHLRREVARKSMAYGDQEPANLYNENVYRKAKQQQNDKDLRVKGFVDPILSIQNLKWNPEYSSFIREVGLEKFYVIYFSDHQIDLYKRWLNDPKDSHLSVDSTGSMWAPIKRPHGDSQELQLYQMVVSFCGKILPVCQLITEKHDAVFIGYWLREWLRHNIPVPQSIVCDFSLALLNACSIAFNEKRLGKYMDDCIRYLTAEGGSTIFDPPECLILLDIAHLIKLITQWSCWAGAKSKKEFFVRAIGLLTKASTLDSFLTTVRDILLVAMSEYSSFDEDHSCTVATKRLLLSITTDAFPYERSDLEIGATGLPQEVHSESEAYQVATSFVNNLISETEKMISPGPIGNPNYSPEFLINFKALLKYFPIWTNVMPNNSIPVSSSARSEEYFRELKRLSLVDKKQRVDKALMKHILNIQGTMKILCAAHEKKVELDKELKKKVKNTRKKDRETAKLEMKNDSDLVSGESKGTNGHEFIAKVKRNPQEKPKNQPKRRQSPTHRNGGITVKDGSSSSELESSDLESDKENAYATPHPGSFDSDKNNFDEEIVRTPLKQFNRSTSRNSFDSRTAHRLMESPLQTPRLNASPLKDDDLPFKKLKRLRPKKLSFTDSDDGVDPPLEKPKRPKLKKLYGSDSDDGKREEKSPLKAEMPEQASQNVSSSSSSAVGCRSDRIESPTAEKSETINEERQHALNAVDNWMGKLSKDATKRGHYLTPCPDFLSRGKRPPKKKKLPLLQNGSMCPGVPINGKKVILYHTCPFDALAQSLLIGYRDWSEYRKCIDESDNDIFKFVQSLDSINKPGQAIYKQRAMIMQKISPTVGGVMDCKKNIGDLIRSLLKGAEPSYTIETTCNSCDQTSTNDEIIIEIPFGPVHKLGLSSLQNIVEGQIKGRTKCRVCSSKDLKFGKCPGKNLFIDLEICMSIKVARIWGYDNWDGEFTLAQLPVEMKVCDRTYKLIAAIEYEGTVDQLPGMNKVGHYVAHTRRRNGEWLQFNDISRLVAPSNLRSRELMKKKKIPILIYIENPCGL